VSQALSLGSGAMRRTADEISGRMKSAAHASITTTESVETTAAATEELSKSIGEIGNQSAGSLDLANHAARDAEVSMQTLDQIAAVAKAVHNMASVASAIATSVVQQSAAANQIAESVQAAASNTKRATEDVQAVEHSTSDSLAVVRDIFTLTERLSSAAADLEGRVGEFFSRVRAA